MIAHVRHSLLLISCSLGMTGLAHAAAPFSFDSAPGRLPKDVRPLDYMIAIVPDLEALVFSGTETVTLQFRAATAVIRFNSLNEKLLNVRVDGRRAISVVSDDQKQLTTVTLASAAPAGRHTLTFSYTGVIEQQPRGLFIQRYRGANGSESAMLSTQMESTDARRMFPCWDEPAFRATFRLRTTQPAGWTAISNMPIARREVHGKLATTTFARSPSMPSYLVEYSAGDLAGISATEGRVKLGVWAVRGQQQSGATALANARAILADYNDYFGLRYPLPKLDSIAIPGGFSGAMENWGAITYMDRLLLLTRAGTLHDLQQVFETQAHEMAHLWNGDLVTMGWWDDIWLNESFAEWMAARETAQRNPDWHWWEHKDTDKEAAMRADARATSHALQRPVADELQASLAVDPDITYAKGQAVLRMFEMYAGADVFRNGIRDFLKAHAYSNATTVDLWNALDKASGADFGAMAAAWTGQAGFPLVLVTAECDGAGVRSLRLSQRRFLLRGTDPNRSRWDVPLQIRSGSGAAPRGALLTADGQVIEAGRCDESLSLNAGAVGYYRVAYDPATLAANTANFARLPDGDRIALLDDQWALVESGEAPLSSYLALASSMGSGLDARAWEQVVSALGTIEIAERGAPQHAAFLGYARGILDPAFAALGFDPRPGEEAEAGPLRRMLLKNLGAWGDEAVIAKMRRRFSAFLANHDTLSADDQAVVLAVVALDADAATFDQLHTLARSASDASERERYYQALADVRDPQLAGQAAQILLSVEIPPQAELPRLDMVAELARGNPQLSWETFSEHVGQLLAQQGDEAQAIMALYIPEIYWNALPLPELEAWVLAHVQAEMSPDVERGMETARFKLAEKADLVRQAEPLLH
ncbi:MAG: M1 family metallopeptidase [Steroidobacterales bacterium]